MPRHSLSEPIRRALRKAASEMHVALPARVERYDHTAQRAEVLPLLRRQYADGDVESMPVLPDVPVVWPRSGGAQMTMPVNKGDTVLLVFSDRSIDRWLAQGGEVAPDDPRQHDVSDAVAIPGLVPFADFGGRVEASENNEDVLVRYAGIKFRLQGDGTVDLDAPGDINLNAGGDVNITGTTINLN